ncbi:hypothetical protein ACFWZZ_10475 [[Kitasatospora] papulosa]|uniref:hypothetical protein n=1 Tax=[Kitasatospora] papulosa TaxID=1464011 RepID=UPI003673AF49
MTHNFGFHFSIELRNHFGSPTDGWPASAEHVTSFFGIVVNALGADRAAHWFVAARQAHLHVVAADQALGHQFGFASHLDFEIGDDRTPSLDRTAAWEAMKAVYELMRRDGAADAETFFDCALLATERSGAQPGGRPVAAAAPE